VTAPVFERIADALEALTSELRAQRANGRAPLAKRPRGRRDPVEILRLAREQLAAPMGTAAGEADGSPRVRRRAR